MRPHGLCRLRKLPPPLADSRLPQSVEQVLVVLVLSVLHLVGLDDTETGLKHETVEFFTFHSNIPRLSLLGILWRSDT